MSIAGSDCSGGAGIQADLKTISALGAYAATAITAITVQNTTGVRAIHPVPPVFVRGQIEAVMDDIRPDAIKIGMINDIEIVKVISACLHKYRPAYVIFDPVMVSTSGHKLIEDDAIAALTDDLMPLTSLITPNLREAEVLQIAGESTPHLFTSTKIESPNTHGTGCTLSSAIATFLALGYVMPQAVECAKRYVTHGIEAGKDIRIGEGHGPLNHFYHPVPMNIKEE